MKRAEAAKFPSPALTSESRDLPLPPLANLRVRRSYPAWRDQLFSSLYPSQPSFKRFFFIVDF
jgi:hypothetical protein